MKKRFFRLIIFSVVSFFLFSQSTLDVQGASCANFSAIINGSSVTLNASGCAPAGRYLVQVLQNDEVLEANEMFINREGGGNSIIFHLSQPGNYQARLLFSYEEIRLIDFSIQNVTPLKCGDPCNPNDLNCPQGCPSRWTGSAWYCLRPEDPNPGEPTRQPTRQPTREPTRKPTSASINNTVISCATRGGKDGVQTALGCVPTGPMDLVKWLFPYLLGFGGLAAFGLIVFSGFQLMTSSGDPQKIQSAKETITSAVTGLIFIILSLFLLRLIGVDILGLPGLE